MILRKQTKNISKVCFTSTLKFDYFFSRLPNDHPMFRIFFVQDGYFNDYCVFIKGKYLNETTLYYVLFSKYWTNKKLSS